MIVRTPDSREYVPGPQAPALQPPTLRPSVSPCPAPPFPVPSQPSGNTCSLPHTCLSELLSNRGTLWPGCDLPAVLLPSWDPQEKP